MEDESLFQFSIVRDDGEGQVEREEIKITINATRVYAPFLYTTMAAAAKVYNPVGFDFSNQIRSAFVPDITMNNLSSPGQKQLPRGSRNPSSQGDQYRNHHRRLSL